MRVVDVPSRASRAPARCSSGPRRSASAARTSTTSSATSALCGRRPLPAHPGPRGGGRDRGGRPGLPGELEAASASRSGRTRRAGLLPVPDRPRQRVCRPQPDRDPPRRCAPGAPPLPATQVFPVGDQDPVERADRAGVDRRAGGRPRPCRGGEKVVVFGAGPIGQARRGRRDRPRRVGAAPRPRRAALERGAAIGRDIAPRRAWSRSSRPRASGPAATARRSSSRRRASPRWRRPPSSSSRRRAASSSSASGHDAPLGSATSPSRRSTSSGRAVQRRRVRRGGLARRAAAGRARGLVTHEFSLEEAPEAIAYAMRHPAEVMKAVIRLDGPSMTSATPSTSAARRPSRRSAS